MGSEEGGDLVEEFRARQIRVKIVIVLLSILVLIGIIAGVIYFYSIPKSDVNLYVNSASILPDNMSAVIEVGRGVGEGKVSKLNFIFTDSSGKNYSYEYTNLTDIPGENESKIYSITIDSVANSIGLSDFSNIVSVSIGFNEKVIFGMVVSIPVVDSIPIKVRVIDTPTPNANPKGGGWVSPSSGGGGSSGGSNPVVTPPVIPPVTCTPNCTGKVCGDNGCSGSCAPGCSSTEDCVVGSCVTRVAGMTQQITQFGITWTFDKPYSYGQFVNGDYWVVGPVKIVSINPPSNPPTPFVSSSSPWKIVGSNGDIRATIYVSNTKSITDWMSTKGATGAEIRVDGTNNPKVNRNTYAVSNVVPDVSFDIILNYTSESPSEIASIGPVSGGNFGGDEINGAVINPIVGASQWPDQGFDTRALHFRGNLNVAYNVSSTNPLSVLVNSSLVSTISFVPPTRYSHFLNTSSVLTVLPTIPPANSFRPPYIGTDKTIRYNLDTVSGRISSLPKLTLPTGAKQWPLTGLVYDKPFDAYDIATWPVERLFERPWLMTMSTDSFVLLTPQYSTPSYGREVSMMVGAGAMSLCMNYTDAEKLSLAKKYVQVGIDLYQYVVYNASSYWQASGGIRSGRKLPMFIAGYMLNDQNMLGVGKIPYNEFAFQEDGQTYYVDSKNVGRHFSSNGVDYIYGQSLNDTGVSDTRVYISAQNGIPEWGISHLTSLDTGWPYYTATGIISENFGSDRIDWEASYRSLNSYSWPGIALSLQAMGLREEWDHNAFFDYMDRYMEVTGTNGASTDLGLRALDQFSGQMWDAYRKNYGCVWTADSLLDIYSNGYYNCFASANFTCASRGGVCTHGTCKVVSTCADYGTSTKAINYDPCGVCGGLTKICFDGDTQDCDTGKNGICSAGKQTCSGEVWAANCVQSKPATTEIVCNGQDDNCDGTVDECPSANQMCISGTCQGLILQADYYFSWWKFDGNANDTLGDNHGTIVKSPQFVSGKQGQAIKFNEVKVEYSGNHVSVNNISLTSDFSISFWVNNSGQSDWYHTILGFSGFNIFLSPSPSNQMYFGNGSGSIYSGINLPEGVWRHIAVVYNGTDLVYFVNGSKVNSWHTQLSLSGRMEIGTNYGAPGSTPFSGSLDEIILFKKALSASEILQIYAAG